MHVCHIWQNFIPVEFGGVERYIVSLTDYLAGNYDCRFSLVTDKAAYVPLFRAMRIPKRQKINSLEVNRLGPNFFSFLRSSKSRLAHRPSNYFDNLLSASLYREAVRLKEISSVDVFHVHGFWQPLYPSIGVMLSRHFHRPLIVTLHGDSINPNDRFAMPLRSPTVLNLLKQANVITTYSRETLNLLQELDLGKTSRLVPNFVNTQWFKRPNSERPPSKNKVMMISRFSKPKDPITPIFAFAEVIKEIPDAVFEIVGYGPLYEYASKLIKDLNLERSVFMVGMKSNVRKFFWTSDLSIGTRGSYITTLEAWAAGTAVIAPDHGIMKEIIISGENGLLVAPGDPKQLAQAIIRLLRDQGLREKLVANGAQTVIKHDIQTVSSSIYEIYKSLV